MNADRGNETWLAEDAGHSIIEKAAEHGRGALSTVERLIYCFWVADYGMRNAGDLATAGDLYPPFQMEGRGIAAALGLPRTRSAFDLSPSDLEAAYFQLFDGICAELRRAYP